MSGGVIYTETFVHGADGGYQLVIVDLDSGGRVTGRSDDRVKIGDRVAFAEERAGVAYFRTTQHQPSK